MTPEQPFSVNGVSPEHREVRGLTDLVLEGAADLVHRSLEGVESVVVLALMEDGSGHICSAPSLGEELASLLEALATGLRA